VWRVRAVFVECHADNFKSIGSRPRHQCLRRDRPDARPACSRSICSGQPADYDALNEVAKVPWTVDPRRRRPELRAFYKGAAGYLHGITAHQLLSVKPPRVLRRRGAVFTDNDDIARAIQVRVHTYHRQGRGPYEKVRVGLTARFDNPFQAAILWKSSRSSPMNAPPATVSPPATPPAQGCGNHAGGGRGCRRYGRSFTICSRARDRPIADTCRRKASRRAVFLSEADYVQPPYRGYRS